MAIIDKLRDCNERRSEDVDIVYQSPKKQYKKRSHLVSMQPT